MVNQGYTLLPTEENVSGGQHPVFTYNARQNLVTNNYRSIFTYSGAYDLKENYFSNEPKSAPDCIFANVCHYCIIFLSYSFLVATFPLTAWFCFKKISRHERLVLFRIGRLQEVKGPGVICILPWIDNYKIVNILYRGFIIPPQQLIMKDGSILEVGGEIRFQVEDVVKLVTSVQDMDHSVRRLGQTLLADILQQITLQDLQTDKQLISSKLHSRIKEVVSKWGINVTQVELAPPKILQNPQSDGSSTAINQLMTSIQSIFQQPNNEQPRLNTSSKLQINSIRTFITETAFPTIMSSGAICGQDSGHIFKLEIEGNQRGVYWLDTIKGRTAVGDVGEDWVNPHVTVTLSDEDFMAIITSQLTPLQAYISGKLRVTGNTKLLSDFQVILNKLQSAVTNFGNTSPISSQEFSNIQII